MLSKISRTIINIQLKDVILKGDVTIPKNAKGLIIFSHGSGSSRFNVRNNYIARILQKRGLATLLLGLLTKQEDAIYKNRFNIKLLTQRLIGVTKWIKKQEGISNLPIGYFGASTGAASALKATAILKRTIVAVVSPGGRPDLAMEALEKVISPTLLIVGEDDIIVTGLNIQAYQKLSCIRSLEIIPNATYLFEKKGTLKAVAIRAAQWFTEKINANTNNDV